jgi:hypothetical protein
MNLTSQKASTTRLQTIYYEDNLFLLQNPDNLERNILMVEFDF